MKRCSIVLVFGLVSLLQPVFAQEATLQVSSKAAYDASIVEMSASKTASEARELILALLTLAAAEAFPEQRAISVAPKFAADEELFLSSLAPYEGRTRSELIAAAEALP